MCNGLYLDIDGIAYCKLLEHADNLLTMRECSLSLFTWYQAHLSYCKSLYEGRAIRVDEACWQLNMLPRLRNVKRQMLHAKFRQTFQYLPYGDEDIPF